MEEIEPLRLFDWKNSLHAIDELETLLRCNNCDQIPSEPQCLGRCDHHYCRTCAEGLENGTCPSCKVPAPPCEMKTDRIISELVMSCQDLRKLISAGKERATDTVTDGMRTPDRGRTTIPLTELTTAVNKTSNNETQMKGSTKHNKPKSKDLNDEDKAKKKAKAMQKTPSSKGTVTPLGSKRPKITTPPTETKKLAKVADLSALGMGPKNAAVNRRNTKGETLLHVACIKGDKEKVEQLLSEGANPNTRDNAGWTPLHEVSSHGFEEIAKLLLRHGALVDPCEGSNGTPLHDAVINGQVMLVKLLRSWGADDTSRNLQGHTPRSLAKLCQGVEELTAALNTPLDTTLVQPSPLLPLVDKMVLLGTGLTRPQTKKLETLARMLRVKLMTEYSSEVTHIVTECTSDRLVTTRTTRYMMGVVAGKWILSHTWMDECLKSESAVSPDEYEVLGCVQGTTTHPRAPKVARLNTERMRPALFSGCHMFLWGHFPGQNARKEVEGLIRAGGGTVLAREPNAEVILEGEHRVPYHAALSGPLVECSHFIIYPDGPSSSQPQIKYDMKHFKSLPLAWLYSCVDTFSLVPPVKN